MPASVTPDLFWLGFLRLAETPALIPPHFDALGLFTTAANPAFDPATKNKPSVQPRLIAALFCCTSDTTFYPRTFVGSVAQTLVRSVSK
jgi:hypothetical protein